MKDSTRKWLNTVSNFPYGIVGIIMMALIDPKLAAIGVLLFFGRAALMAGSSLFHFLEERWAQASDEIGMYLSFLPMVAYAVLSFLPTLPVFPVVVITVIAMVGMTFTYKLIDSFVAVPILVGIPMVLSLIFGSHRLLAIGSLASYLLAIMVRTKAETAEGHDSALHSVWHVLTSVGDLLLFLSI